MPLQSEILQCACKKADASAVRKVKWRERRAPDLENNFPARTGYPPANTGRKMRFTGTTVLKLKDGKITEEIGLDDGVTALQQLGLIKLAA